MTKIQWTDQTANPLKEAIEIDGKLYPNGNHCVPISTGCKFCFASILNARGTRFGGNGRKYGARPEGHPEMWLNMPMLERWKRIRKPKNIFVGSMTDWGGEWVPEWMIAEILEAMRKSKATFQLLSKRPERIARLAENSLCLRRDRRPPPNIWLGTSAEDQQCLDERLPWLLRTPAAVRFLSLEPLLGPIEIAGPDFPDRHKGIGWVIIGGESGPHARPLDLNWVRGILAQCKCYGIPAFVKQLGSHWAKRTASWHSNPHPKGGDPAEWPAAIRVRMMPGEKNEILNQPG